MTAAKLIELEAKATEGKWLVSHDGDYSLLYVDYPQHGVKLPLAEIYSNMQETDAELIAYLRNHCKDFIRLMEAAENRTSHYKCEDPWYSCPKSESGCADDRMGPGCTCGADEMIEALAAFKEKS